MNANLRIPDDLHEAAQRLVEAEGTALPDLLSRLIRRRLRNLPQRQSPRQRPPGDPEWQEWRQELL
jgi:hypothetical protein